ncbi:MAG: molecular chaperone HtpG [Mycoplasmatales bacterium]
MANKKKFKTESKQLLDLMIHSIYSNKDVFLRELISNASDANDKRHFKSLTNKKFEYDKLEVNLELDKDNRTISIIDNGIGMDEDDLDNSLSTIAKSGTKEFMEKIKNKDTDTNAIGQFGVGFYSSFIVSDKVVLETKKEGSKALKWTSDGIEYYNVSDSDKKDMGTCITLHLREGEEFNQFLEQSTIEQLVKKYSDFIKYPIIMEKETSVLKEGSEDEYETKLEKTTLNSMQALWKKSKRSVKDEEYNSFYMSQYMDFQEPLITIHAQVEGTQNYSLLAFVPKTLKNPFGIELNQDKGLDLYSKGILIEKNVEYLLDDSLSFVKGLVDSDDLNLNISREMLQKDETVTKIQKSVESKIVKELEKLAKKDKDKYQEFFKEFGTLIKFGIYNNYGAKKDLLKDLLVFKTSKDRYVTLKEFTEELKEDNIYYLKGDSIDTILNNPALDKVSLEDKEVLYLLEDVDEFCLQALKEYDKKEFKNILDEDFSTKEEQEKVEKQQEKHKDLLKNLASKFDSINAIKLTSKLKSNAYNITNEGPVSIDMEKVLVKNPEFDKSQIKRNLELNPNHKIFKKLVGIEDTKQRNKFMSIIYDQALIMHGLEIEDKEKYVKNINDLLV